MRVNLHDYSGHPFQVQLSRELAARGHEVLHTYAAQYVTGRGRLTRTPDDPATLRIEPIVARSPMVKYSPRGRIRFELDYADAWQDLLERESFDVVVSCNVPLLAAAKMRRYFERTSQRWLFWHQDIYSLAIGAEARRRLPGPLGRIVARRAERAEADLIRSADGVVAITDEMLAQYGRWSVAPRAVDVIPNWAPLEDITPVGRDNAWARELGLPAEPLRLLYAGTLGRKHNPLLLLEMLDGVRAAGIDALLVVVSEGDGADELAAAAGNRADVRVVGYQPADRLSEVLSSADAVVALLEPDAGKFSVPSKVLSYLSAGRPIVALLPAQNPAAADVLAAGGYVGEPTSEGAAGAAAWLSGPVRDRAALATIGRRARMLAEHRFDIVRIADRFERAFAAAAGPLPSRELAAIEERIGA
jgi:glycosyltransferase involved in cell wall biosynthesis